MCWIICLKPKGKPWNHPGFPYCRTIAYCSTPFQPSGIWGGMARSKQPWDVQLDGIHHTDVPGTCEWSNGMDRVRLPDLDSFSLLSVTLVVMERKNQKTIGNLEVDLQPRWSRCAMTACFKAGTHLSYCATDSHAASWHPNWRTPNWWRPASTKGSPNKAAPSISIAWQDCFSHFQQPKTTTTAAIWDRYIFWQKLDDIQKRTCLWHQPSRNYWPIWLIIISIIIIIVIIIVIIVIVIVLIVIVVLIVVVVVVIVIVIVLIVIVVLIVVIVVVVVVVVVVVTIREERNI